MHPFVLQLNWSFEDRNNCYLVFEYLKGGSLWYYLDKGLEFTEK